LTRVPDSTGDLAVLVLQRNTTALLEHAPGARAGADPHHVHQMRVATRRMRAALRLFADVLPSDADSLNDELKWFASQLGPVRDLDVQMQRMRTTASALGISEPLVAYAGWLEDQHHSARTRLADAFESRRFGALVQHLQRLDAWSIEDSLPVLVDAPRRLRRAYRQLRKYADAVGDRSSSAALHAVRIRGKRLRYTAEFFEESYGKRVIQLVERVVILQDLLGNLQDGIVSRHLIQEAVQSSSGASSAQTALALGQLVQFEAEREKEIRAAFPQAYKSVRQAFRRAEAKTAS